jgi:hypothetical protein
MRDGGAPTNGREKAALVSIIMVDERNTSFSYYLFVS